MAKSKFFRVAVSGPTIDGREIDAQWLKDAAAHYNPATYAARGNLEHVRGITGDKPFTALADVIALKAEDTDIVINGKTEKRTGLFAQIEPTADLITLNKNKQKLYTSIEIHPDFAGTKKAGLLGLAFTDSPASLGTERLEFTSRAKANGNFISEPVEIEMQLETEAAPPAEVTSLAASIKELFAALLPKPAEAAPVVVTPAAPAASGEYAALTQALLAGNTKIAEAIEASTRASTAGIQKVADDLAAFKAEVEKAPASTYTQRPVTSGGGNQDHLADF